MQKVRNLPIRIVERCMEQDERAFISEAVDKWRLTFEGEAALLLEKGQSEDRVSVVASSGISPRFLDLYEDQFAQSDPWLETPVAGEGVCISEDILPPANLISTDFYSRWLCPQELGHGIRAIIRVDDDRHWVLMIYYHALTPAPQLSQAKALSLVLPLLRAAAQMLNFVGERTFQRDAAVDVLDHLAVGVILMDGRGRPVVMNRSASEMIEKHGVLYAGQHGVYAAKSSENQRLQQMIERVSADKGSNQPIPEAVPISRGGNTLPLAIIGASLNRARGVRVKPESISVALFICDPGSANADLSEERLMAIYTLTRLEARLAARLASGRSLEEIAADLRVSIHTVRAYLKQIFAKTNVHRQSDLVRVLTNGSANIRNVVVAASASVTSAALAAIEFGAQNVLGTLV